MLPTFHSKTIAYTYFSFQIRVTFVATPTCQARTKPAISQPTVHRHTNRRSPPDRDLRTMETAAVAPQPTHRLSDRLPPVVNNAINPPFIRRFKDTRKTIPMELDALCWHPQRTTS